MHQHGPISQLRLATRSPGALVLGSALGGFVPVATYAVAHYGGLVANNAGLVTCAPWTNPGWLLVVGGLSFSAKTVYMWGCTAFDDRFKAAGFVGLVEGSLLLAPIPALAYIALGYLVLINAIATGCLLALRDRADRTHLEEEEAADNMLPLRDIRDRREVHEVHDLRDAHDVEDAEELEDINLLPEATPSPAALPSSNSLISARDYLAPSLSSLSTTSTTSQSRVSEVNDSLYERAVEFAKSAQWCSATALRRGLGIRQERAAELMVRLERDGIVAPAAGARGRRAVLVAG